MTMEKFEQSYADFGLQRSARQVAHALASRGRVDEAMRLLFESMAEPEQRIEDLLGRPVEDLDILEVGPGQGMERARYFGRKNRVVGIDRDIIPPGFEPGAYWRMARTNGVGRVVKTLGRQVVIGRAKQAAFAKLAGPDARPPELRTGDIESEPLADESIDIVMSWSVFEHLGDPAKALDNLIAALRPGGVLYISIHIYTAHDGHHDIRAFTGQGANLPLWGHLRPAHAHEISPSSYLNEWRLDRWRQLFDDVAPGHTEYLDQYEVPDTLGPLLVDDLRDELSDYSDDELLTVNAVYAWRKPTAA